MIRKRIHSVGALPGLMSLLFAHFLICCMYLISLFTTNHKCLISCECVCIEHIKMLH